MSGTVHSRTIDAAINECRKKGGGQPANPALPGNVYVRSVRCDGMVKVRFAVTDYSGSKPLSVEM